MKDYKDISEDQIRVIGESDNIKNGKKIPALRKWLFCAIFIIIVAVIAIIYMNKHSEASLNKPEPSYFEPVEYTEPINTVNEPLERIGMKVGVNEKGFTEMRDTVINDIPLRILIPHNAEMTLQIGMPSKSSTEIVYVAQAADVRADNGGIVGAFVLEGKPLAWGLSKKGYCASINGKVSIGVAENSPLFEQATEQNGYFFRQYPLVNNGKLVENEPKGKTKRRGICDRAGEIFIVESLTEESFHDFAQALVDLKVDNAIYLVGSSSYGWIIDKNNVRHEFGNRNYYKGRRRMPKNTSYIVWKRTN